MAAYLTRLKGSSREHAESDLRCFLAWSAERGLDPLAGLPDRWWVRAAHRLRTDYHRRPAPQLPARTAVTKTHTLLTRLGSGFGKSPLA